MPYMNKILVMGHLGGDPETRYMPSGAAVTTFTVATAEKWKDRDTGEQKEKTTWHKIECWGKTAEFAAEQCFKGQLVLVEGAQHHNKSERDGQVRYFSSIRCERLNILQWRDDGDRPKKPAQNPQQPPLDDDIPF